MAQLALNVKKKLPRDGAAASNFAGGGGSGGGPGKATSMNGLPTTGQRGCASEGFFVAQCHITSQSCGVKLPAAVRIEGFVNKLGWSQIEVDDLDSSCTRSIVNGTGISFTQSLQILHLMQLVLHLAWSLLFKSHLFIYQAKISEILNFTSAIFKPDSSHG